MNDKQLVELSINCNKLGWQIERFRTLLVLLGDEKFQNQLLHDLDTDIAAWISAVTVAVDQGFELDKWMRDNVE